MAEAKTLVDLLKEMGEAIAKLEERLGVVETGLKATYLQIKTLSAEVEQLKGGTTSFNVSADVEKFIGEIKKDFEELKGAISELKEFQNKMLSDQDEFKQKIDRIYTTIDSLIASLGPVNEVTQTLSAKIEEISNKAPQPVVPIGEVEGLPEQPKEEIPKEQVEISQEQPQQLQEQVQLEEQPQQVEEQPQVIQKEPQKQQEESKQTGEEQPQEDLQLSQEQKQPQQEEVQQETTEPQAEAVEEKSSEVEAPLQQESVAEQQLEQKKEAQNLPPATGGKMSQEDIEKLLQSVSGKQNEGITSTEGDVLLGNTSKEEAKGS